MVALLEETEPSVGIRTPARILMSVDLPHPLRPTIPTRSPGSRVIETLSRMMSSPNWRDMLVALRMGMERECTSRDRKNGDGA